MMMMHKNTTMMETPMLIMKRSIPMMTVMALFDDADADAQDEEDKSIWMLKMSEVRMSITPKRAKRMKKAELEMFLVSSFPSSRVQYDGVFENRIRCAVVT